MSKARVWAETYKTAVAEQPRWKSEWISGYSSAEAEVTEGGRLQFTRSGQSITLEPRDALSLGRWLVETFGG